MNSPSGSDQSSEGGVNPEHPLNPGGTGLPAPAIALGQSRRQTENAPTESRSSPPAQGKPAALVNVLGRTVRGLIRFLLGVLLVQSALTSVVVIGWTYRLMQRVALMAWWKQTKPAQDIRGFERFLTAAPELNGHAAWPNWVLAQPDSRRRLRTRPRRRWFDRPRIFAACALGSLKQNLKLGVQGILNIWALTMPAGVLWLFSWYDGWNNSFNKGYEQAAVGPALGIVGLLLFIGVMLYLPMAQARQAISGEWRRFFDFRIVGCLIRRSWAACAGLALLYATVSIPVTILKTAPQFFPQINPDIEQLSGPEALRLLNTYFFWCGFVCLPAYVLVHAMAARIYARALPGAVQAGALTEDSLARAEWRALHTLDLLRSRKTPRRPGLLRALTWTGGRFVAVSSVAVIAVAWFAFVAQIYISEFLLYHPKTGFLNQPLVQLPWFQYIPGHLRDGG